MSIAANASGRTFEGVITGLLTRKGIPHVSQCSLSERSIFGRQLRVDVLIEPCDRIPNGLIIEAKWQDVTGSAEEKLPFLVENIKTHYPYPAVIVIDGSGFTAGAMNWLLSQVDGEKLIAVMSIKEFISWCNREI